MGDEAAVALASAAPLEDEAQARRERTLALWITNVSHMSNHFQNQMVSVLYPVMMAELGFNYAQLGLLVAIRSTLQSGAQVIYGFLAPFMRRPMLLFFGNVVLTLGTLLSGLSNSFAMLVGARTVAAVGSSAQHPVGSSMLAGYFPDKKATVLSLNTGLASIGSLIAPLAMALLLNFMGWRQIFLVIAPISAVIAMTYLALRSRIGGVTLTGSKRDKLKAGGASYLRAIKNRNILVLSLVFMVGAAGRGDGVNATFLAPHFMNDLLLSTAIVGVALAALQIGSIGGPLGFGWLADKISHRTVMQVSLVLSAIFSVLVARAGADPVVLIPLVVLYGAAVTSRNPLTQALVADALSDEDRDAAFSLYYFIGFISTPLWSLITGGLMQVAGFETAFTVLAASYVVGVVILFFLDEPKRVARPA
ncbi:MAG: MFS transporter [Chloroflexota bacterium]|nr:MFS transporter [Chloroflexota bacterium]MDE3194048.1 MFS transporter [Chloroflexota bacterium]